MYEIKYGTMTMRRVGHFEDAIMHCVRITAELYPDSREEFYDDTAISNAVFKMARCGWCSMGLYTIERVGD